MYDKDLALDCLCNIEEALRTIIERSSVVSSSEALVLRNGGMICRRMVYPRSRMWIMRLLWRVAAPVCSPNIPAYRDRLMRKSSSICVRSLLRRGILCCPPNLPFSLSHS